MTQPEAVQLISLEQGILPVFRCSRNADGAIRPLEFRGTGFIAVPSVAVTCYHVVSDPLAEGEFYALLDASATLYQQPAPGQGWEMHDITQHAGGYEAPWV